MNYGLSIKHGTMKKIVIIGASSGMGLKIASDFARMGWRVGMAARHTATMDELKKQYPSNTAVARIDVTEPDAGKQLYNLIELIDGMDVLLYCAGCGWNNPELDEERDMQTLHTNVVGFTRIANAAYKYFRDTANVTPGQIAVITSIAGTKGIGVSATYSASKRYQSTYLQALDQLAHQQHVNVRITEIRPGFVDTPLLDTATRKYPMTMSVDYVAPRIERAILKQKRRVTVDSRWAIVTGLWRLIPDCLWRHIALDTPTR